MPISKKTIEHIKTNDLCPRCGQPNVGGKSLCQKHLDQFAAKTLKYRHARIDRGLCPQCNKTKEKNQYYCSMCIEKNKPKQQKFYRKKYKYIKENSLCYKCGQVTADNKTRCEKCSIKDNQIKSERYKDLFKNNLCVICGKNQVENQTYCEECVHKRGEWYKESNTRIKNKIERQEESKKVFDHYGNKCICCGTKDLDVLSIDHINDDGYKHRKQVGSGATFYRWIIKNNFPPDLQILCWNCNIKKYKQTLQQKLNEDSSIISDGVPTREKKDEILAN